MELKSYQKEVLQDLSSFLDIIHEGEPLNKAFASYWLDDNGTSKAIKEC